MCLSKPSGIFLKDGNEEKNEGAGNDERDEKAHCQSVLESFQPFVP